MKKTIITIILFLFFLLIAGVAHADIDILDTAFNADNTRVIDGYGSYIATGGASTPKLAVYQFNGTSFNLIDVHNTYSILDIHFYNETTIFIADTTNNALRALYFNGTGIVENDSIDPGTDVKIVVSL
jgi:hypothetical protein